MKTILFTALCTLSALISGVSVRAQPGSGRQIPIVKDTLNVALAGSEPFVIAAQPTGGPEGIAVEVWAKIADMENLPYRYKPYDSVAGALAALKTGDVDMVAGPISITSQRLEEFAFSQPYFQSSLGLLSRENHPSLWQRVKPFFSAKLLVAVGSFLFILAVVGTLFWIVEHKASPEQFPKDPVKGIGNGMWLAIVTMTTTGYGDLAPVTLKGRVVAGMWMVITLIFATSMIAGIASVLTLSSLGSSTISTLEQLNRKKAATVNGSPAEGFLDESHVAHAATADLDGAIQKLEAGEVDAVVYDRPQLRYYLKNHPDSELYLSSAEYYKQGYGFVFAPGSDLVYSVNLALLYLAEDRETETIFKDYLGRQQ